MKNKRILTTLLSVMLVGLTMIQAQPKLFVGPNQPLGEGKGIHPGRVVWVHSRVWLNGIWKPVFG